jgi:hypothetical protein
MDWQEDLSKDSLAHGFSESVFGHDSEERFAIAITVDWPASISGPVEQAITTKRLITYLRLPRPFQWH